MHNQQYFTDTLKLFFYIVKISIFCMNFWCLSDLFRIIMIFLKFPQNTLSACSSRWQYCHHILHHPQNNVQKTKMFNWSFLCRHLLDMEFQLQHLILIIIMTTTEEEELWKLDIFHQTIESCQELAVSDLK